MFFWSNIFSQVYIKDRQKFDLRVKQVYNFSPDIQESNKRIISWLNIFKSHIRYTFWCVRWCLLQHRILKWNIFRLVLYKLLINCKTNQMEIIVRYLIQIRKYYICFDFFLQYKIIYFYKINWHKKRSHLNWSKAFKGFDAKTKLNLLTPM